MVNALNSLVRDHPSIDDHEARQLQDQNDRLLASMEYAIEFGGYSESAVERMMGQIQNELLLSGAKDPFMQAFEVRAKQEYKAAAKRDRKNEETASRASASKRDALHGWQQAL